MNLHRTVYQSQHILHETEHESIRNTRHLNERKIPTNLRNNSVQFYVKMIGNGRETTINNLSSQPKEIERKAHRRDEQKREEL